MNTFKEWMLSNFSRDELADMCRHGANVGWHGLIYYSETTKLYQQYKDEIWEMLYEDAESFGMSPIELINNFQTAKSVTNADQFENLLIWYGAEKIAYDTVENNE